MKREVLLISLLLMQPAYAEDDIGIKTGGYSTENVELKPEIKISDPALQALQPVPNVPVEAPKKAKKPGKIKTFFLGFHPDHIEQKHPKINKGWNGYMFVYDHGLKQTLDIAAKAGQIKFGFF